MSTMTSEKRRVYDTIMTRENVKKGVFFIYGYDGTKTIFIWRVMSAHLYQKRTLF